MVSKRILLINDYPPHFGGGGDEAFRLERLIFEAAGQQAYTFSVTEKSLEFRADLYSALNNCNFECYRDNVIGMVEEFAG